MMRAVSAAMLATLGALALSACGSSPSTASGTYTVAFQSVAQAVSVQTVHVLVFDASASADTCIDLLVKSASQQDLPAPIVDLTPVTPCDLARGASSISLPFQTVAVLAIAEGANGVVARGCTRQSIGDGSNIVVDLASVGAPPPASTCASLAQRCANGC